MTKLDYMTLGFHVRTKFMGPTNHRGSRVKATTVTGKSVTLDWDHALNSGDNHAAAFAAICMKTGRVVTGPVYVNGGFDDGYVFMAPTRDIEG
ncbi:hypothetical protein KOAAANKH_02548 [Brevundimonas sp. NIBR10]|uniref:hypothetical protein n=1 Tax=Brevundimonas sp. NIBR10 TaxID=3015997 RepID=UPI0022F19722|nr:hypothetical protein [Brevundimonas sp. NIBR10]WGM47666.1 hypothetical protein KOAAANKH_02548 [Brevundimonas sp. NIBR10]